MKQGSGGRRSRRGNGKRSPRNQNFDSNGPDVRVRGNAQQVLDRYLTLARDAQSAGDRVSSENYFQHAEHYFRILHANGGDEKRANEQRQQPSQPADIPYEPETDDIDNEDGDGDGSKGAQWERTNKPQPEAVAAADGDEQSDEATSDAGDSDSLDPPSSETIIA